MDLLKKATDKEFWKSVREKDCFKGYRDGLLEFWKTHCEGVRIKALTYSEFSIYEKTGNRSIYEGSYFERRHVLDCAALLSLIYPEEERYLVYLMDTVYAICDEYTWCLPAHQPDLNVNNNANLDLFATETGFALAEVYTMLGDRLEPLIRDRIRAEIDRRILPTYFEGPRYWWETGVINWAAVCAGSVGCTVMLMHPELAPEVIPRVNATMDCFLSGFKDDGICLEGCGYWHYGFGFFVMYADMVRNFTNGEIDFFKREKVKTIATFMQKMFLSGNTSVSFADCGLSVSYTVWLLHYLKREYPDDILVYSPKYSSAEAGSFPRHVRSFLYYNEEYAEHPADDSVARESYAADSEWFIKRTPCYGFAAKGGNNAEYHNHNDVGNFIFAKNGRQMITDMGSGKYFKEYFYNDVRYTLIECSSRGHNVPSIAGADQHEGKDFKARGTRYENGVFCTDIAGAYDVEGLGSIERSFAFTDEEVTLFDRFDYTGSGAIVEKLVALVRPEVFDDHVRIDEALVYFDGSACDVSVAVEERNAGLGKVYLVCFTLKEGVREFKARIR